MTDQNKMLIESLERRLLWYREEASEAEFDAEEVDAICTMLLKLSPAKEPHRSGEEAYENIMRQIRLEEERSEKAENSETEAIDSAAMPAENADMKKSVVEDSRHRRRFFAGKKGLRAAVIFLAAVGVLASLNMVSYARENKSLFTIILERAGWVKIRKEQEVGNSIVGNEAIAENFYDSWGDLDREVKERLTVPAYIPEGYSLYGLRCWNRKDEKIIQSDYYDQGNGHLGFEITLWEDNVENYRETLMDETIYTLLSEYSDENTLYYECEDEYICLVYGEKSFYRINGNVSLEEMMGIREGLGNIR